MDTPREFEILVRRKIPFVSDTIFWIGAICIGILFIFYVIMAPTEHASAEMSTAYYILVVPEWLKTIFFYAGIGFLITILTYYRARLHKPAKLIINVQEIAIQSKTINLKLLPKDIDKVFCNDLHTLLRRPRGILQFVIRQKSEKTIAFRLKNYEEGDQVLEALTKHQTMKVAFFEDDMIGDDDE